MSERQIPHMLREFMKPGTESYELTEPRQMERIQLQRIADAFFGDQETVSLIPSADLQADRLRVLIDINNYLKACERLNYYVIRNKLEPFASESTKAERGKIEFYRLEIEHSGYCYDGGCYSDDNYTEVIRCYIYLISQEQWEIELGKQRRYRSPGNDNVWEYNGIHPYDDALVFRKDSTYLYMHHPFGSNVNLCIHWDR